MQAKLRVPIVAADHRQLLDSLVKFRPFRQLPGVGFNDDLDGGVGDGFEDVLWGGDGADRFKYDLAMKLQWGWRPALYNRDGPRDFAWGDGLA